MLNSLMSIMGSPAPTTPAANVTIETTSSLQSRSQHRRTLASNSTILEFEHSSVTDSGNIVSPSVSPVKVVRENSMMSSSSSSGSSFVSEENLSMNFKHSIDNVDLDNPTHQKMATQYLLEKIRDHESLMIRLAKQNQELKDELSDLYKNSEALAAENLLVQDLVEANNALKNEIQVLKGQFSSERLNFVESNNKLQDEVQTLKQSFSSERDFLRYAISKNVTDTKEEVKRLYGDIDFLDDRRKEMDKSVKDNTELLVHIQEELVRLERNITTTNQYCRRENLIIDGIPDYVSQANLENVCLEIIHGIGFLPVGNYEVVGCHRLKKTENDATAPTIIRFINRKVPEFCKRNKWRLKTLDYYSWNLSFREDLCVANQAIYTQCEDLKRRGYLKKVFTHNGFVKVAVDQERPMKLSHMKDVSDLFPDIQVF